MTVKDDQIAWLMQRVEFLERELASERARRPLTSTERSRLKRERDAKSLHVQRLGDAPVLHCVAPPIERVDPSGSSSSEERVSTKTLSGDATLVQRNPVAFDIERATADASKHGLVGAAFEAELQRFRDYWDSAGWKRKNGPVRDRNATFRSWLDSPFRHPTLEHVVQPGERDPRTGRIRPAI